MVAKHEFIEVHFDLGAGLQWSNLLMKRGVKPDDPDWEDKKSTALADLHQLEEKWIEKFQDRIEARLGKNRVFFNHWQDLAAVPQCRDLSVLIEQELLKEPESRFAKEFKEEREDAARRQRHKWVWSKQLQSLLATT